MTTSATGLSGWFKRNFGHHESIEEASQATTVSGGDLQQDPVVVWEAANQLEAQIVKGRLESEGIPAIIRGEAVGVLYGLTTGGLAVTDVLVPAALAEQASHILSEEMPADAECADVVSPPDETLTSSG